MNKYLDDFMKTFPYLRFQFADELYRFEVVADALGRLFLQYRLFNRLRHDEIAALRIRLRGVCGLLRALLYVRIGVMPIFSAISLNSIPSISRIVIVRR